MNEIDNGIILLINNIKKDIVLTRNKVLSEANKELISMYFRIGKVISENAKYGNDFINTLSTSLKMEFPEATGYSPRNLARIKSSMIFIKIFQICQRHWQNCHGLLIVY